MPMAVMYSVTFTDAEPDDIVWEVNETAANMPITDDPDDYFSHLDLEAGEDDPGKLDNHSRFLIGDWPR